MGAAAGSAKLNRERFQRAMWLHMMPVYYTEGPMTTQDILLCRGVWNKILTDDIPSYQTALNTTICSDISCKEYFYSIIHQRLMLVQPTMAVSFSEYCK